MDSELVTMFVMEKSKGDVDISNLNKDFDQ